MQTQKKWKCRECNHRSGKSRIYPPPYNKHKGGGEKTSPEAGFFIRKSEMIKHRFCDIFDDLRCQIITIALTAIFFKLGIVTSRRIQVFHLQMTRCALQYGRGTNGHAISPSQYLGIPELHLPVHVKVSISKSFDGSSSRITFAPICRIFASCKRLRSPPDKLTYAFLLILTFKVKATDIRT